MCKGSDNKGKNMFVSVYTCVRERDRDAIIKPIVL